MMQVTIHQAKTNLSRLLMAVERGEHVIVARASRPVARIVPYETEPSEQEPGRRRCFGVDASGWRVPDDFDSPLPDGVLDAFE